MMNINEFIERMKAEVRECLPDDVYQDIIIDNVEVVKMNDQKLHGLSFKMPGVDAAPTLYVNEMYEAYKDGADIEYLASEMANMYSASRNAVAPPQVDLSYDNVKDNPASVQELHDSLESAVKRQLMSDVPYGVLLSGGLDSSVVSALAKKHASLRVETGSAKEAW